ncbi:MAG: hypothetical protein Q9160_001825 [Pyrenula sp. 1 TL-2023]
MEQHVTVLVRNLSDNKPHDCFDQLDRFTLDVASDVFFGESAGTLSTDLQPVRDAFEEIFSWNAQRMLMGSVIVKPNAFGFNFREAYKDTFLPTGGGPAGKDRVAVLKGTKICKLNLVFTVVNFAAELSVRSLRAPIVMSSIGIQRRHDLVGPNADEFDPYRWETWAPRPWEFFPFNHGPRPCLGRNFAWRQMEYLLCRVFQEFSTVELIGKDGSQILDGPEIKAKLSLNMPPAEPVIVRFGKDP